MHTPSRTFASVACLLCMAAVTLPSARLQRPTPLAAAPVLRTRDEIQPAIYKQVERGPEVQDAWVQLLATFELARSSQEILEEAQSLRAIAAALASGSLEARADREAPKPGTEATESDRANRELSEGQLALADKILSAARAHAANAQAAFGMAWQNVQRASQDNAWQDPGEPLRESALHRRYPG